MLPQNELTYRGRKREEGTPAASLRCGGPGAAASARRRAAPARLVPDEGRPNGEGRAASPYMKEDSTPRRAKPSARYDPDSTSCGCGSSGFGVPSLRIARSSSHASSIGKDVVENTSTPNMPRIDASPSEWSP